MAAAQRIYARALYEAASDKGAVADVRSQLGALKDALEASPELAAFLSNPQLDPGAKADVLGQISEGSTEVLRNFLRLVASKGRAGELRVIAQEFDAIADAAEGRIAVELTTAHALSDDEAASIVKQIESASGRSVEATRSVDASLIGGLILQAGSLRVDASVRGRLERLRRELATRN
ncbi:MAG: ATP synthase F1 subunit delta [Actinobacteria bacterium]|nr:ATP synthase F1 subunit delta [Actinomycetota bacterium]